MHTSLHLDARCPAAASPERAISAGLFPRASRIGAGVFDVGFVEHEARRLQPASLWRLRRARRRPKIAGARRTPDFEAGRGQVEGRSGSPTPAANLFLPGDAEGHRSGRSIRRRRWRTCARPSPGCQRLGTETVVFGSGGARRVPGRIQRRRKRFKQLVDFGKRAARRSAARTASPSPSSRCGTPGDEHHQFRRRRASSWSTAIADPNFQLMIDFYHLASEKEDPSIVLPRQGSHPPPAHGEPDGARLPAEVGGVRLRPVLRQPAAPLAVRRQRQRLLVDDHHGAPAGDAILLANSSGLARPFSLSEGDITVSPFARLFLSIFVR